jgi:hypothetical protein
LQLHLYCSDDCLYMSSYMSSNPPENINDLCNHCEKYLCKTCIPEWQNCTDCDYLICGGCAQQCPQCNDCYRWCCPRCIRKQCEICNQQVCDDCTTYTSECCNRDFCNRCSPERACCYCNLVKCTICVKAEEMRLGHIICGDFDSWCCSGCTDEITDG